MEKPVAEHDLPIPFDFIGGDGWAQRTRDMLTAYGVPLPATVSVDDLAVTEERLGLKLPPSYRMFLAEIGALDLGSIRFLPPSEVGLLTDFFAKSAFSPQDVIKLGASLGIVDYLGTGDFIALDLNTTECSRCRHDPPGFSAPLPSLDALVQYGFISLPSGYYGWDDEHVHELVEVTLRRRFGFIF